MLACSGSLGRRHEGQHRGCGGAAQGVATQSEVSDREIGEERERGDLPVYFCVIRDPLRVKVLENYAALSTRQKVNVDRAMQSFVEMLDNDQDYLPAVLGMATGFMIEKNQVR